MPYGIKTESAIFQSAIEQDIVTDIKKNTICYQDNICVGAINDKELKWKKLKNAGFTINEKNVVHDTKKITKECKKELKKGV